MNYLHATRYLAMLICFAIFVSSCADKPSLLPERETDKRIDPRTTVFEEHNAFILWAFENYSDSLIYFQDDPSDFMHFMERRQLEYTSNTYSYHDDVIDDDELILPEPFYVVNSGFSHENGSWSATEYDSLYVVIDSLFYALANNQTESDLQDIISRGETRIDAVNFTHEDEVLTALTQLSYSVALMYDIDEEYFPTPGISTCVLVAACADVETYTYFAGLGDFDFPGTAANAWHAVSAVSCYAYNNCR